MSEVVKKKLTLFFPKCECEKPIVCELIRTYDLTINIFRAKVTPDEHGYLVLDVAGTEENIARALDYVRTFDVKINDGVQGLVWDRRKCTDCGNCLTICPTGALRIADGSTREVAFNAEECIECLACVQACPYGACTAAY